MVDLPFGVGVERSRLHAGLLVGDVLLVVLVLSAGMLRHNENPLELPGRALLVIGPFVVGWLVAAVLLGAYTSDARRSVGGTVVNATVTWFVAALVGSGLRATSFLPGNAPLVFVGVVVGTGAVGMVLWRGVFTAVVGPAGR